ncbi:MAG: glutathione S-transferase [Rhodospirillaceae bacterium]|nr:glutathione S-transferase [Rhodospirillaceae bacterium]MBT7488324.1 glutathione S-transferase [Rhodospirillales bacterium]MBT4700760.1 glutathione S-transferase [Rhodospirillaceae bacterium]MBT5034039.1 glutathione S-transferase [Rhodospirillaceae bacterium]MBT6218825.1 glutathione S-transferase [Rhodospirillaceae bacterium]
MTKRENKGRLERPLPTLYSFRRCPYAMRARMALTVANQQCRLREIVLRDKPREMTALSPKATVPVLHLIDGRVLEQSLDIMLWALDREDPEHWLSPEIGTLTDMKAFITELDGPFKHHLDRYKYATRYDEEPNSVDHRAEATNILITLNDRLSTQAHLFGTKPTLADFATFPFIRQFANTDRDWFDKQPLSNLQNWLEGHLTSDLFQSIMKKWPVWGAGDPEPLFPDQDWGRHYSL